MLRVYLDVGLNYDANSLEFLMLEKERERKRRGESIVGGRKKERNCVGLAFVSTIGLFICHVLLI